MTKDNSQNEIIRIQKKRNNFVMLDKGFLEDSRLSFKAKGILAYLLSKPDNWRVIVKDLANHSKDGRDSIYAGLKELKEYRYYIKKTVRNEKGVITHWEGVIYEDPTENPESLENRAVYPFPGFPDTANPDTANPDTANPDTAKPDTAKPDTANPEHNNNYINNNYVNYIESSQNEENYNYINYIESSQSQRQTEPANIRSISNEGDSEKLDKTLTPDDDMTSRVLVVNDEEAKKKPPPFTPVYFRYRQAEAQKKFSADDYTTYAGLIKLNIDFESFSDPDDRKLADSLIGTMLDVILTESPNTVKIGKETKSRDIVRSVYLKLNHGHIAHVMCQYRAQSRRVIFKNAYLRTMLFNTYTELEAAAVNKRAVADNPEVERQPQQPPAKEMPQKKNRFINFDQREIDFDELERLELEQLMSSMKD